MEVCLAEVCPAEVRSVDFAEVRPAKVRPAKVRLAKVRLAKVRLAEFRIPKVWPDIAVLATPRVPGVDTYLGPAFIWLVEEWAAERTLS